MPIRIPPRATALLVPLATLGLMAGILIGRAAQGWWPVLPALAAAVTAACTGRGWLRTAGIALCAACVGALLGWRAWHPVLPMEGTCQLTGTIVQEVALREDGQVRTILEDAALDGRPFPDGVYWTYYLDEGESLPEGLLPGATVTCTARVYHPEGRTNPDGFDFREYLLQRGVTLGAYGAEGLIIDGRIPLGGFFPRMRHALSMGLMEVMGPDYGAYAAAMLIGSQDFIAEDDSEAFRQLGIAHILSVSGYHVGVLAMLVAFLLSPLPLSSFSRISAAAAVLSAYCLLTGGDAPVIRATLLLIFREISRMRYHQALPLHMLCITAAVQLLFSPAQLTSASFQLTYGAMLGLLLVCPRLVRKCKSRNRLVRWAWQALCASLSAQLGILLPQLYWFGELPVLSLLVNLALMPFSGVLMASYWVTLACLPLPGLRVLAGAVSSLLTWALLSCVRALAGLDIAALWTRQADLLAALGWCAVMVGLSTLLAQPLRPFRCHIALAGGVLMALLLLPLPVKGTACIQLDVGDADSALLMDEGAVVAIDTGEDGEALAAFLHHRRWGIDALYLSHLHSDHAGGLRALLDEGIPVDVCYLPHGAQDVLTDPGLTPMLAELAARDTEIRHLRRGDVLPLPSGEITVLWPPDIRPASGQDANHYSLVLQVTIGGVTMLYTGDITSLYEHYAAIPADLLKVAHHGSTQSTSPAFLAAVAPQALLLSNGSPSRLDRMRPLAGSIPLYDTGSCGAITLRFPGGGAFRVETYLTPP